MNKLQDAARGIVGQHHVSEHDADSMVHAITAALTQVRRETLEEAAQLMEQNFNWVSERPSYDPAGPGAMRSPTADAIRSLAERGES